MKNKLFLALALAGVMACKKDKPAEPNNSANDVSAQVTNFINNLDLTKDLAPQVQAFASTLKNDKEMEGFLVGKTRASNVWELEKFTGTVKMDTIDKRAFSWDKTNPYDTKGSKKVAYDNIGDFIEISIEFEKAMIYGTVPNENNATEEKGVYYLSNGVIVLSKGLD